MKSHKKLLLIIFLTLIFFQLVLFNNSAYSHSQTQDSEKIEDRLEKIKKKGVLTVASSNDIPISYIDPKTNEFIGIDADIIKEAARRLGINKVEMKEVPFANLLTELNSVDDIDIVADGMYITDDRKKEAAFTDIWYKESEAIVTPKISKINFKENLKDAIVGAQKGTAFLKLAQKWKEEGYVKDVVIFNNQNELLSAVNAGKIDAAVTDSIVASYLISQDSNLYLKVLSQKEYKPEAPGNVAAAVRKNDTTFLNALNKTIDEMKEDKTIIKILKKYGLNEDYFVLVEDGHISNS